MEELESESSLSPWESLKSSDEELVEDELEEELDEDEEESPPPPPPGVLFRASELIRPGEHEGNVGVIC